MFFLLNSKPNASQLRKTNHFTNGFTQIGTFKIYFAAKRKNKIKRKLP